jgi:hypothetical protein
MLLLLLSGDLHVIVAVLSELPEPAAVLPVVPGAVVQLQGRAVLHCKILQGLTASAAPSSKDII